MDHHECIKSSMFSGVCIHQILQSFKEGRNTINGQKFSLQNDLYDDIIVNTGTNEKIRIFKEPRTIKFISGDNIIEKYVIGIEELFQILNEIGFTHPYFEERNGTKFTLEHRNVRYFQEENIIYNNNKVLSIDEKKFMTLKESIALKTNDLLNVDYLVYYPSEIGLTHPTLIPTQRIRFFNKIEDFIESDCQIDYLTGPSSIGKSVSLLMFQKWSSQKYKIGYFNIKVLSSQKEKDTLFNIFKRQFLHLSSNLNEMNDMLYLLNFMTYISTDSIFALIESLLIYLSQLKTKCTIIIDQYKQGFDPSSFYLNKFKDIIKGSNIKLIICSSINNKDVREIVKKAMKITLVDNKREMFQYFDSIIDLSKFREIIEKEELAREEKKIKYKYNEEEKNNEEEIKKMVVNNVQKRLSYYQQFNFLPKYYYMLCTLDNEQTEFAIEETKEHFRDKIKQFYNENFKEAWNNMNKLFNVINKEISEVQLQEIINDNTPLKYLVWNFNHSSKTYMIQFFCDAVKEVFIKEYKKYDILRNLQDTKMLGDSLTDISGEQFELCANIYLEMQFKSEAAITVESLVKFGNVSRTKFKGRKVFITQTKKNARTYDCAILDKKECSLVLFQITITKRPSERLTKELLVKDYEVINQQVKETFSIEIPKEKYFFYYVLFREKLDTSTISYCKLNNIAYLILSLEQEKFCEPNELTLDRRSNVFGIEDEYDLLLGQGQTLILNANLSNYSFLNRKRQIKQQLSKQNNDDINKKRKKQGNQEYYNEQNDNTKSVINRCKEFLAKYYTIELKNILFTSQLYLSDFKVILESKAPFYYVYNNDKKNLYIMYSLENIIKIDYETLKLENTTIDDLYSNVKEVYYFFIKGEDN